MAQFILGYNCQLLGSCFSERTFKVAYKVFSSFQPALAGVPQGSVLVPLPYLIYTVDIQTTTNTVLGTSADDTVIMTTDEVQKTQLKNSRLRLTTFADGRKIERLSPMEWNLNTPNTPFAIKIKSYNFSKDGMIRAKNRVNEMALVSNWVEGWFGSITADKKPCRYVIKWVQCFGWLKENPS